METRRKMYKLGFTLIEVNQAYPPVFLRAQARPKLSSNSQKNSRKNKTIGEHYLLGKKEFEHGKWYNLWCMYGRNKWNEYSLYCKEKSDKCAYEIIDGTFAFEFNAEAFATIAIYASRANWEHFAANCFAPEEKEELDKFLTLIDGKINSNSKTRKIKNFVSKLRKTL